MRLRLVALATGAGVLILMQLLLLSAALDLVTSAVLFGIGFIAGRLSR